MCKTALAQYSNGAPWDMICKTTLQNIGHSHNRYLGRFYCRVNGVALSL